MKRFIVIYTSICLFTCLQSKSQAIQVYDTNQDTDKIAIISGKLTGYNLGDSLVMDIWDQYLNLGKVYPRNYSNIDKDFHCRTLSVLTDSNGCFKFRIKNVGRPIYISIGTSRFNGDKILPLLELFLIEPGDSIYVNADVEIEKQFRTQKSFKIIRAQFTGIGSAKYSCQFNVLCKTNAISENWIPTRNQVSRNMFTIKKETSDTVYFPTLFQQDVNHYDSVLLAQLDILSIYKNQISNLAFELIKTDLVSIYDHTIFNLYQQFRRALLRYYQPQDTSVLLSKYLAIYNSRHFQCCQFASLNSQYLSKDFALDEEWKLIYSNSKTTYQNIKKNYNSPLRDKLLAIYFTHRMATTNASSEELMDALSIVTEPNYRYFIYKLYKNLKSGAKAIDFSLLDINGKTVHLEDFTGKAVFMDFWFTNCTACAKFYKNSVSKVERSLINDSNIVFISISIDENIQTWRNSVKQQIYTTDSVRNVINLYTNGLGALHPLILSYAISGYPFPLILDKDHNIYALSTSISNYFDNYVGLLNLLKSIL